MTARRHRGFLRAGTRHGLRAGLTIVPTFVAIFAGFGVAAQVADLPPWVALGLTAIVYAAPAQFAIVEIAGTAPAAVAQMIVAAILINLRFVVMSMTLSHLFPRVRRGRLLVSAQFVAASAYLLTFFRSRRAPPVNLHDYFRGISLAAVPAALGGTALGLAFGAELPQVLAFGASLFLPVYFALLLAGELKSRPELAAAGAGLLLTPPAELLLPGWGMFLAALGTGALLAARER